MNRPRGTISNNTEIPGENVPCYEFAGDVCIIEVIAAGPFVNGPYGNNIPLRFLIPRGACHSTVTTPSSPMVTVMPVWT